MHTPGPWRIGDAGRTIFGPKTDAISPATICQTNRREATLIATAPELLEKLYAVQCYCPVNVQDEIRALLAKAGR